MATAGGKMIEFVTEYDTKISVNPKYIMTVQPKRKDILCNVTVITFINDKFLEVAHSYNDVLEMINEGENNENNRQNADIHN